MAAAYILQAALDRLRHVPPPPETPISPALMLQLRHVTSINDLTTRVLAFIAYYNQTMARPFKWTYQGKALAD